ncbi:hypothetical protein MN608_08331 [Microdochium nivale]|nr:hypothetical protein MN608_08331 [Microdochium nivale]
MTLATLSMLFVARDAEGDFIAKASHQLAPIPPSLFGHVIVVAVYFLSIFSAILVGLRVYVRSYLAGRSIWQMGWDDYFTIAGFCSWGLRLGTLYMFGHTVFWTIVEAGLGIMACSLPPLRALFAKFYRGSSGQSGAAGNASATGRLGGISHHNSTLGRSGNKADPLRSKTSTWDRLDDEDDASTQGIVRLTEIRVESSHGRLPSPRQAANRAF